MNNFIKMMSKEQFKTSEPFGSALWPNLLCYRLLAFTIAACPMPCIFGHRALAIFRSHVTTIKNHNSKI